MIKSGTNILFVHIPKNAGTSIRHSLLKSNYDFFWNRDHTLLHHDPYINLEKINQLKLLKYCYKFTVCRNPFTRAYSYYKHFCKMNNINDIDFLQFLKFVQDKQTFPKTPMISYDQTYYVLNKNGNIVLDKIYRFENLRELEVDFGIKLSYTRKSNYSNDEFYKAYDDKTISLVKHLYMRDFITFQYSTDFTENLYEASNL